MRDQWKRLSRRMTRRAAILAVILCATSTAAGTDSNLGRPAKSDPNAKATTNTPHLHRSPFNGIVQSAPAEAPAGTAQNKSLPVPPLPLLSSSRDDGQGHPFLMESGQRTKPIRLTSGLADFIRGAKDTNRPKPAVVIDGKSESGTVHLAAPTVISESDRGDFARAEKVEVAPTPVNRLQEPSLAKTPTSPSLADRIRGLFEKSEQDGITNSDGLILTESAQKVQSTKIAEHAPNTQKTNTGRVQATLASSRSNVKRDAVIIESSPRIQNVLPVPTINPQSEDQGAFEFSISDRTDKAIASPERSLERLNESPSSMPEPDTLAGISFSFSDRTDKNETGEEASQFSASKPLALPADSIQAAPMAEPPAALVTSDAQGTDDDRESPSNPKKDATPERTEEQGNLTTAAKSVAEAGVTSNDGDEFWDTTSSKTSAPENEVAHLTNDLPTPQVTNHPVKTESVEPSPVILHRPITRITEVPATPSETIAEVTTSPSKSEITLPILPPTETKPTDINADSSQQAPRDPAVVLLGAQPNLLEANPQENLLKADPQVERRSSDDHLGQDQGTGVSAVEEQPIEQLTINVAESSGEQSNQSNSSVLNKPVAEINVPEVSVADATTDSRQEKEQSAKLTDSPDAAFHENRVHQEANLNSEEPSEVQELAADTDTVVADSVPHAKTRDAIVGTPKRWSLSWLLANGDASLSPVDTPPMTASNHPIAEDRAQVADNDSHQATKYGERPLNPNEKTSDSDVQSEVSTESKASSLVDATVSAASASPEPTANTQTASIKANRSSKNAIIAEAVSVRKDAGPLRQHPALVMDSSAKVSRDEENKTVELIENPEAFDKEPESAKSRVAPVAISAVPAKLNRQGSTPFKTASQQIMATPVLEMKVQGASSNEEQAVVVSRAVQQFAPNVKRVPLFMKRAQVRSITFDGHLQDIRISDSSVCEAVLVGANRLKLIAAGHGIAEMVVWARSDENDQAIRMRIFRIHVGSVDPSVAEGGRTTQLLHKSIHHAFPECEVTISHQGADLVVSGRCTSRDAAERIIRMVRSTCLVTVHDRLSID